MTMQDAQNKKMTCYKCNLVLELRETNLKYQGCEFSADLLQCPGCGLVYISEDLVKGRMREVEKELEDK
jgi:predicted RNA-binding Zn-ribbon protein involved in translation (DUF1610 family)